MAGGEIAGDAQRQHDDGARHPRRAVVFDRIEAGKFQSVDFIEAYICPDGCVSGSLTIEGRYAASAPSRRIGAAARRAAAE